MNRKWLVVVTLLAVLVTGLFYFRVLPFPGFQSVVSQSVIEYADGQNWLTVSLAVNNSGESYWFIPHNTRVAGEVGGKRVKAVGKDVAVRFKPEQLQCSFPLRKRTKGVYYLGFRIADYTYYTADQTNSLVEQPLTVTVYRGTPGGILQEVGSKRINMRTASEVTFNSFLFSSTTIPTLKVEKLGELAGNRTCPDASNIAVISVNGEYRAVDRTELVSRLENTDWMRTLWQCSSFNSDACRKAVMDYFVNLSPPPDIVNHSCNPAISSCEGIMKVNSQEFVYTLPDKWRSSFVLIKANEGFVGGFVFEQAQGKPRISLNPSSVSVNRNEEKTIRVTVENIGSGTDDFEVWVNQPSSVSIQPASVWLRGIAPGQSKSFDFRLRGVQKADSVRIVFGARGQQGVDTANLSVTVKQENVFCGNGYCEGNLGETCKTCPIDCGACPTPSPSPTPSPIACQYPLVQQVTQENTPTYLVPFPWGGGLIQTGTVTQTTQQCVLDPTIALVAVGLVIIVPLVFLAWRRFK